MAELEHSDKTEIGDAVTIRRATETDLKHIATIDEKVTNIAKPDYWNDIYERYEARRLDQRFFLVAEANQQVSDLPVLGYIVGEIRGWEFGSEPCGWIFAFSVDPGIREQGIGENLFEAISDKFKAAGVRTMRTMVDRHNRLHMAFFRSEGMVAGSYIQLEKELDD